MRPNQAVSESVLAAAMLKGNAPTAAMAARSTGSGNDFMERAVVIAVAMLPRIGAWRYGPAGVGRVAHGLYKLRGAHTLASA